MELFLFSVVLLFSTTSEVQSSFAVCGNSCTTDQRLLEKYVSYLKAHPSSEVLLSAQLVDPAAFNVMTANTDWLLSAIQLTNDSSNNIGKLAYQALAVMSICKDPERFGNVNTIHRIEQGLHQQFRHHNSRSPPRDGWYSFGLATQALCVARRQVDRRYVVKILNSQKSDGSFASLPDVTSQICIALVCLRDLPQLSSNLRDRIAFALRRAKTYLASELKSDAERFYIGNRHSSAEALLALHEMRNEGESVSWFCNPVAQSFLRVPRSRDPVALIARSLQALGGASVLQLREGWTCHNESDTLGSYVSTTTPTFDHSCQPLVNSDVFLRIPIRFSLSIEWDDKRLSIALNQVIKDETLFEILIKAQCSGLLRFRYKITSWGPMLMSLNSRKARKHRKEYWSLLNGKNLQALVCGIAEYQPSDGDEVIIKLTHLTE